MISRLTVAVIGSRPDEVVVHTPPGRNGLYAVLIFVGDRLYLSTEPRFATEAEAKQEADKALRLIREQYAAEFGDRSPVEVVLERANG